MIENLNTSIFKLLVLTSLSHIPLFSQAKMQFSNQLSLSQTTFSRLLHPVLIYRPLSAVSFDLCLFSHIQTTAIHTPQKDFIHKRIVFQFDGSFISFRTINITQCIFKYCISHYISGCFNIKASKLYAKYNIFSSNRGKFGGAFHSLAMNAFVLDQNLFDKNKADYFGAGYIDTISSEIKSSQNNFTRNHGYKWVGALEVYSSRSPMSVLKYIIFDQNSAKHCAAFFDLATPKNFHNIDFGLFANNSAERRGGAITDFPYCFKANYSHCVFVRNRCNEGNCIYIETKKAVVMLFNCFFDCNKEKALYFNWAKQFPGSQSKIIFGDDVVFEDGDNKEKIKEKELEMRNSIPSVKKLDWFLPEN